jgi:hypothetical protein
MASDPFNQGIKADKAVIPVNVKTRLLYLPAAIEQSGPVRGNWPNYWNLDDARHHYHNRKGKPCYGAVWEVTDKKKNLVEVTYVGTHQGEPY